MHILWRGSLRNKSYAERLLLPRRERPLLAGNGDSYEESKPGNDKPKSEVKGSYVIPE